MGRFRAVRTDFVGGLEGLGSMLFTMFKKPRPGADT